MLPSFPLQLGYSRDLRRGKLLDSRQNSPTKRQQRGHTERD